MQKVRLLSLVLIAIVLTCCTVVPRGLEVTREPQGEGKEKIHFHSDQFEVVGDLVLPEGSGPFPAVILVHGDGPVNRTGVPGYRINSDHFLDAGYAVFSWDKPGSGESTGEFDSEHKLTERAAILADGVQVLVEHPSIDPAKIGLWGISQAGWVMPLALKLTDDVAFMIVVSGGGEDSIDQMAFQLAQKILINGGTSEEAAHFEQYEVQMAKATTYDEYRDAMKKILRIPDVSKHTGIAWEINDEDDWKPWPRDIDAFLDPMEIIDQTTIPMLVFFGAQDVFIDPIQGAEAYESALQEAGNQDYQVVLISDAGHVLTNSAQYIETLDEWIQHLSQ
jgi:dipeptidyl aminopeptidase/acylaminoacyl peptidase